MNSVISKIIASMLSLLLLAYVGYQSFVALYNPYQTELVSAGTYVTDVDLNGFFVRSEEIINIPKKGVISYNYKNAQKISKDATVAFSYQSEDDLFNLQKIEALKTQKSVLAEAQNKEAIKGVKLDLINNRISQSKAELRAQVDDNNFTNIEKVYESLLLNINKIAVCVDETVSYDSTISAIDSQIASLEAKLPTEISEIKTEKTGYFSNTIDGLEGDYSFDSISDITVAGVEEKMKKKTGESIDNIGKLVYENYWYFVSTVTQLEAEELAKPFNKKQPVKLKFNSKSTREITATIESISLEKDIEKAVVVFKSYYLDEDLINMRFETPKVIISSYDGIIIPKEAVRIQDGVKDEETGEVLDKVKGVYALFGKNVQFKKADIMHEDDFVLVSRPNNSSDYVSIYDQVIIRGKNMENLAITK